MNWGMMNKRKITSEKGLIDTMRKIYEGPFVIDREMRRENV